MGLLGLTREIAMLPVQLAPSVAGLAVDATRHAARRVGESLNRSETTERDERREAPFTDLAHRHRRYWLSSGRAHIELRTVEPKGQRAYLDGVDRSLCELAGVTSVSTLPGLGRVVVYFNEETTGVHELIEALDEIESNLGVTDRGFRHARGHHPSDKEPIESGRLLVAADAASMGIAATSRALRVPTAPFPLDVAGLLTVVSYVPWLRDTLDRRLESPAAGFALAMARAITGGLGQQVSGPAMDIVHRASQITAASTRRSTWERLEPELTLGYRATSSGLLVPTPRPGELPQSPIERVALPTSLAAFAGAGIGLLLRPNVDQTLSFLVAGSPKAARWGRQAHAAHIGMLLASRDVLVMDVGSLDLLDRINTMVVTGELISLEVSGGVELEPFAADLLGQARAAGVDVWVATDRPERFARLPISGTIEDGEDAVSAVRSMQASGRGVAVVAAGEHPALAVGDVTLGLRRADRPLPWNASMIGGESLLDGYVLALAIESAKRNARQAAALATAGTGVAGLMTLGGLRPGGLSRVMGVVNLSALIAHLNGMRIAAATARQALPQRPQPTLYHAMPPSVVMAEMGSGPAGLTADEASRRLIPPDPPRHPMSEFLGATGKEMVNPLTPILAAGAGLAAAAGTMSDAAAVAGVMGLNAVLGGAQRFRADRATRALLARATKPVTVVRDNQSVEIDSSGVVPGDIVHLQAGDVVPADCRIISANALEVDESSLTGESMPVAKATQAVEASAPVPERASMLYAGTMIAAGSTEAVAVAVGADTEAFHGISLAIGGPPETGVEQRLEDLTARVSPISVSAGLAVVGSGLARGLETSEILGSGVGLAVAAVPEGLPLLATAAQQAAARRLSARGVIVRNARAIEALGRVDVICADKTGTLTVGKIRVDVVADAHGQRDQPGEVAQSRRRVLAVTRAATPEPEKGRRLAHPTDRAVIYAIDDAQLDWASFLGDWTASMEIPFEPSLGYHAALGRTSEGELICVKGAPEVLLPRCSRILGDDGAERELTEAKRREIHDSLEDMAHRGLRILAIAEKRTEGSRALGDDSISELTYIGCVGLNDPLRPTSRDAVADLRSSHIRVLMITGDHPATARGIAGELDLSIGSGILTGAEIEAIDDDQLARRLSETDVCARVTPAHKVRIVRALRQTGLVVAMTGDGANDAPAIRLADVGIALGTRATDAARSASDLVVVDDAIETIVAAVVEGRALWSSVRDAISILVGGNMGEVAFTLAGSLPSGKAPLNTKQLLLVNLMTDALPAMAIAVSRPPDKSPRELMAEGPDKTLGKELDEAIVIRAAATAMGAAGGWIGARFTGRRKRAGTVALVSLIGTELGQTLVSSWKSPLVVASSALSMAALAGVVQTPGLSQLFGCTPLGPVGWAQAMSSATTATMGAAVAPRLLRRRNGGENDPSRQLESRSAD